jgi:hypothetical protein
MPTIKQIKYWESLKGKPSKLRGTHPEHLQGKNHPMFGKHHSVKSIEKIKLNNARKGNPSWQAGKTKKEFPQLSNAGAKNGNIPWNKGKKNWMSEEGKASMIASKVGKSAYNKGKKSKIFGVKHHNWKGGITPAKKVIRESLEYKLWRSACLERDNFTCQKYGTKGGYLVVHHINNFAEQIQLRFAIDNGITLSKQAHLEFHTKYGFKNNTREQLEEFLIIKS